MHDELVQRLDAGIRRNDEIRILGMLPKYFWRGRIAMIITRYDQAEAYRTKDSSEIRELMHPDIHGNRKQSLAEARILPGQSTMLHKHVKTEELYHFLSGKGVMIVGLERLDVAEGDTVCIPRNTPHKVMNTDSETMKILCCCCPPYRHEDTVILEEI